MWPQTKDEPHIHHQTPKHLASTLNYKVMAQKVMQAIHMTAWHLLDFTLRVTDVFSVICRNVCVSERRYCTLSILFFTNQMDFSKWNQASLHFSTVTLYTRNVIFKTWKGSTRMYLFIQSIYVNVFVTQYYSDSYGACFYINTALHIWMTFVYSNTACCFSHGRTAAESFFIFLPYHAAFMMERLTSNLKEAGWLRC